MNRTRWRIGVLCGAILLLLTGVITFAVTIPGTAPGAAAETPRGRLTGGQAYDLPAWFKKSFLAMSEDVEEVRAQGRHVLLFMHLADCPYCARLLDENFRQGEAKDFIQRHFDVIAIDIRGTRTIEWIDGQSYTEKELATATKVVATPTLVFMNAEGEIVLRLNGYRRPRAFRRALGYVHGRHYRTQTLASFVEKQNTGIAYRFRPHPKFVDMKNFKGHDRPLAVIFEDKDCTDCDEFHTKVLVLPEVQPELERFTIVRLDAYSTSAIIDLEGRKTTPKDWARQLNVDYRPGIVLFNEGKERARMDGMRYRFHFKELLRYVGGRRYRDYPTLNLYNATRREELLKRGVVIDYAQ